MNSKSGEVMTGLLIGLAVGAVMAFVAAKNEAKHQANLSGTEVSVMEVIKHEPGAYALKTATPAVAGAGLGWLIESINDKSTGDRYDYNITQNGDQSAVVIGEGSVVQEQIRESQNEVFEPEAF